MTATTHRPAPEAVLRLWSEYRSTGSPTARDRLVLTLAPMVKFIVYRKMREIPPQCEVDDFISCGLEALISALDRYDPQHGTTIEQFVWTRIHGAVLDELRRNDWAPRTLRRWERDIARNQERFIALYRRRPTRAELADALGISEPELMRRQDDIARSDVGSLNVLVLGDEDAAIERVDTLPSGDQEANPEYSAMRSRAVERFREAFTELPQRERQVAVLLYVEGLTLREIGEVIGVTESRVCQLHAQMKRRLRVLLNHDAQLFAEVA